MIKRSFVGYDEQDRQSLKELAEIQKQKREKLKKAYAQGSAEDLDYQFLIDKLELLLTFM